MFKTTKLGVTLLVLLMAGICFAQDDEKASTAKEQPEFYRLDFLVKEIDDGKVINSRAYSTMISARDAAPSSIRTGNRLPLQSGESSFQFFDVGVNIDCRQARAFQNQLSLNVTADISSVVTGTEPASKAPPLVRNTRWSSNVVVPIKKPTTIFSSDDATTKRKMQLELTATPIQ